MVIIGAKIRPICTTKYMQKGVGRSFIKILVKGVERLITQLRVRLICSKKGFIPKLERHGCFSKKR
jgi:hypothetical protein